MRKKVLNVLIVEMMTVTQTLQEHNLGPTGVHVMKIAVMDTEQDCARQPPQPLFPRARHVAIHLGVTPTVIKIA